MNDATRRIQTRGRLLPEDFPPYFRDRCVYLHEYTEVVNGELRLRAYRQRMQETLQENRTVLWQQYADFAQVLTNVSRELDSGYGADPLAEQRLIRYLRTVGVEADAAVFRESTGRLRVTIDSRYLRPLLELPDYLDKLSAALGVRLCMQKKARAATACSFWRRSRWRSRSASRPCARKGRRSPATAARISKPTQGSCA